MQNVNVVLPSTDELVLIKQYLYLFRDVYGLTNREVDLLALLMQKIKKEDGVLKDVLDFAGRAQLRDELDLTESHLNTTIYRLRQKNVITKNERFAKLFDMLKYDSEGCIVSVTLKFNNATEG